MTPHKGKRLCITGIPTAGKSTLTRKLAEETNGIGVYLDDFREELASDEQYRKWVNFYLDQDEVTYYTTTTPEDEWKNLVAQSEALWPAFLKEIDSFAEEERTVIFECVNLLPHLVKRDLPFPCVVLVGTSYEETLARNREEPRWGSTEQEIELNAKSFWYTERPKYCEEGKRCGFPVFETPDAAHHAALMLLS